MSNIILIGMPGSGKSTVGVVLAKILGFRFVDSDLLLQERTGELLHEIIKREGTEGFWRIENEINLSIEGKGQVIATGGSAVYGKEAMAHFKTMGEVVYLQLSLSAIDKRLGDLSERGVTVKEGQSLSDLYEERIPLYEKWADFIMDCEEKSISAVAKEIAERFVCL